MNHMQTSRAVNDIKDALKDIGCDVSSVDGMNDLAEIIRKDCLAGPVVNAVLEAGPGVRIVPMGKKGYKISATSGATLEADLTDDFLKGTAIQKVLHYILYHAIPCATKAAASAPSIVRMDLIKLSYDGVDYYENPAFGPKGQGRRSGLTPNGWYLRLFTHQMKEPFYTDLSPLISATVDGFKVEVSKVIDRKIDMAMKRHIESLHKPNERPEYPGCDHNCGCGHHHHKPCPKPDTDVDPGFLICPVCGLPMDKCCCHHHKPCPKPDTDVDPGFLICPDCGLPMDKCCCHHKPDTDVDPGFMICPDCGLPMDKCCCHHHKPCEPKPNPSGPCARPIDSNNNGICDVCGWPTSEHGCPKPPVKPCDCPLDNNLDGVCDICGLPMSLHPEAPEYNPNDLNGDGLCDSCGLPTKKEPKSKGELDLEKYLSGE